MVQLFASVLLLDTDGDYYLVTPVEKVRIRVQDCPFVVTEMDIEGQGHSQQIQFTTNTGEKVIAGQAHQICLQVDQDTGEPHPIVHIRSGLNALINRAVFYRMVDIAEQTTSGAETVTGLWSDDCFFELGRLQFGD